MCITYRYKTLLNLKWYDTQIWPLLDDDIQISTLNLTGINITVHLSLLLLVKWCMTCHVYWYKFFLLITICWTLLIQFIHKIFVHFVWLKMNDIKDMILLGESTCKNNIILLLFSQYILTWHSFITIVSHVLFFYASYQQDITLEWGMSDLIIFLCIKNYTFGVLV